MVFASIIVIRELPVNNLPILIIIIDTDFTDLHRRYSKVLIIKFLRVHSALICVLKILEK
jgi:hypothetical protein